MHIYNKNDLTYISNQSGIYYLIDYRDLLSNPEYFGDILEEPTIVRDQNQIHQVQFEKGLNSDPTKEAFETSIILKNKFKNILKDLDSKRQGNPSFEQAYLILSHFENRWLEADNLTFNKNGTFLINQWGISPRHVNFPDPPQKDNSKLSSSGIKNDNKKLGEIGQLKTGNSNHLNNYFITFLIVALLSILLGVLFINQNNDTPLKVKKAEKNTIIKNTKNSLGISNSKKILKEKNEDISNKKASRDLTIFTKKLDSVKPKIRLKPKIRITDSRTDRSLKDGMEFFIYDENMALLDKFEGEAIDSFTLNSGNYKLAIHNKIYFSDTVDLMISEKNINQTKYFPLTKKGFFRRIIEKFKK